MRCPIFILSMSLIAAATLAVAGCGQQKMPSANPSTTSPSAGSKAKQYDVRVASAEGKAARPTVEVADGEPGALPGDGSALPLDEIPAEELTMPKVLMSQAHAQMCRVQVGDPLPDFELSDLEGRPQSLAGLLGKKLTVVVFWNGRQGTGLEELADLGPQVEQRFGKQGVAVIGVNTGDSPKLASELAKHAGASFVNLSDPEGKAFAQVGSGKIPRTYLLDASGTIVWFDIEYSRTTRRELSQAIRYLLAQR